MKVIVRRITHLGEVRRIVLAAVQLADPGLKRIKRRGVDVFLWDNDRIDPRIEEVRVFLGRIFAGDEIKKPDLVVFSEYSIPVEAHDPEEIPFQKLADGNNCIIVAGSYFQAEKDKPFFRHNICKIYIPKKRQPITICKALGSPRERGVLESSDELPNIARLLWHPKGLAAPVSINIFLCRDYLAPFRERQGRGKATSAARLSLLDWDREGLNVAVMNNKEPFYFEGIAGLDIREIHGKPKLVLLANSANREDKLATALIGATTDDPKERDVVARFSSAETGVLFAETRLWDLKKKVEYPDKRLDAPVHDWAVFQLRDAAGQVRLEQVDKQIDQPESRGIYHPAFLLAMRKRLIIELFVARSAQKVDRLFTERPAKIKHVSAGLVRGIEDVLIRRYNDIDESGESGNVPSISKPYSVPFCLGNPTEFQEALDMENTSPTLRAQIDARAILKFRGEPVSQVGDIEWKKLASDISDVVAREGADNIVRFAHRIPPGEKIPKAYEKVFIKTEDIIPLGRNHKNQNRETYLFIVVEGEDGKPAPNEFKKFIDSELMLDPRVREICRIGLCNVLPDMRNKFQYLLRLKCPVWEADDIIAAIQRWASNSESGSGGNRLRVGSRSYDMWRRLTSSATSGIVVPTMDSDESNFMATLLKLDDQGIIEIPDIRAWYSDAIARHQKSIQVVRPPKLRDHLEGFFANVCLFNLDVFKADAEKRNAFAKSAADHWRELFEHLESAAHPILALALDLKPNVEHRDLTKAMAQKFEEDFRDRGKANAGQLFWYKDFYLRMIDGPVPPLVGMVARAFEDISGLRNLASHGGPKQTLGRLITVGDKAAFDKLDKKVAALCALLVGFEKELGQQSLEI